MATSGVVLRETGDFYALPFCTVKKSVCIVQPVKTRMYHMTRIQAIHIIAIWSVSSLSYLPSGALHPSVRMTNRIHSKMLLYK